MEYRYSKCAHCGAEHLIGLISFAGIPVETCPDIPQDSWGYWYTESSDPNEDRTISIADRGLARQD